MLIDNLRKVLRELDSRPDALEIRRQMTSAFNGEGPRRSNNRRPRTDLMVKGLAASPFCDHGLLGQVAAKELGLNCSDSAIFSYERYFDIAYFAGNWWEGTQRNLLVAEVENNWAELRGTIRDLLYAQSRLKWGVFYQANLEAAREEISIALRIVRADFDKAGFAESPSTRYEILVLPERIGEAGLLGERVLIAVFDSQRMATDAYFSFELL